MCEVGSPLTVVRLREKVKYSSRDILEEMNARATRGNVSYGEKEYYIRKYEEYLMKEFKKGYSDLHKFLVVNFIEQLRLSKHFI